MHARVAAVYDIHGNLPALEAVLSDIRMAGVDLVVVGGDVVPGPMPCESLDALRALAVPVRFIQGNGEAAVLAHLAGQPVESLPEQARESVRWSAGELRSEDQRLLSGWPPTVRVTIRGLGEVLFCHATPRNHTEMFTRQTPEDALIPVFKDAGAPLVVCGHTHMPFDRVVGTTRVVNAGSVGMPFGPSRANWLLLGPGVDLRRTEYDLADAATRIRATSYPQADAFVEHNVLHPPSEDEMLAAFSRAEIGADARRDRTGSENARR